MLTSSVQFSWTSKTIQISLVWKINTFLVENEHWRAYYCDFFLWWTRTLAFLVWVLVLKSTSTLYSALTVVHSEIYYDTEGEATGDLTNITIHRNVVADIYTDLQLKCRSDQVKVRLNLYRWRKFDLSHISAQTILFPDKLDSSWLFIWPRFGHSHKRNWRINS